MAQTVTRRISVNDRGSPLSFHHSLEMCFMCVCACAFVCVCALNIKLIKSLCRTDASTCTDSYTPVRVFGGAFNDIRRIEIVFCTPNASNCGTRCAERPILIIPARSGTCGGGWKLRANSRRVPSLIGCVIVVVDLWCRRCSNIRVHAHIHSCHQGTG